MKAISEKSVYLGTVGIMRSELSQFASAHLVLLSPAMQSEDAISNTEETNLMVTVA